ncbi:hypothetical protein GCG54_00010323 [Colletotrichum gloeosporioides]|uniref:Uncharacterized protein n=1 Tax=Colletotrichum gloeosporioides TaxID=474922 RepID=A0A8H4CBZ4_COLGL|nr:uncharacterized protein GCG54_00010323 [Colletotrichum gloeosporioides]KAF3801044.1 hypothetical protein GCG54_00010323 [Colletotrichum gloeosporioides]
MEAQKPSTKRPKVYRRSEPEFVEHINMAEGILNMIEKDTALGLDLTVPKRFIRHFLHPKHNDETRQKRNQEISALLERFECEDAENEASCECQVHLDETLTLRKLDNNMEPQPWFHHYDPTLAERDPLPSPFTDQTGRRLPLLAEIQSNLQQLWIDEPDMSLDRFQVTPHLWAVCQLASIDQLEALLGDLCSGKITWKDMHKRATMFLDDSPDSLFACKVLDLQTYDMSALKEVSEHVMSREAIWGSQAVEKYREMLCNIGPEGAGNMVLRLCPRHRWDNAQYAFEPLEQTADSLRVRFRFLPDTRQKLGKESAHALVWDGNLARDPEEFLRHYPLERDYDHNICLVTIGRSGTHELRDGQIIEIRSKIQGRRPEFLLWEMRYKARLMVTMISAAQPGALEAHDAVYDYEDRETMSCTPG